MNTNVVTLNQAAQPPVGVRKVDASRGSHSGAVSSQWFMRPDDQRFLNLDELYEFVKARGEASWAEVYDTKDIRVLADRNDTSNRLTLMLPDEHLAEPTHWAFGQLCQQIGFPAAHYRNLPAPIAAIPLQYGLVNKREEIIKVFVTDQGNPQLRSITSPNYGRILDKEVVEQVLRIAKSGEWKVPGVMDWGTGTYDPNVPVSKRTTTLYASDRDVFVFLCRDQYPIEVGKLPNGDPDLLFPGFIVSNSETGAGALNIDTMYLRGVCCNRNLWGVEEHTSAHIRHTKFAPERFAAEATPALESFVTEATGPVVVKVKNAKGTKVASDEDEQKEFLAKMGFAKKSIDGILGSAEESEGHPAESVWDFVQGITAWARDIPRQDDRVAVERQAGKLMAKV